MLSCSFLHGIIIDAFKSDFFILFFELIHCNLQNEKMSINGITPFKNSNNNLIF